MEAGHRRSRSINHKSYSDWRQVWICLWNTRHHRSTKVVLMLCISHYAAQQFRYCGHSGNGLMFLSFVIRMKKKAQLSLTNLRDAKACQKLLQFDMLTTLSPTILAYLHSFSCCCVRNLRNRTKFTENSNLWSSRSSKVIDLGVNRKPMYDFLLVTNSNFGRICYRFRDIHS